MMSTIEQENQGYTPKEQDLIRQLVQARLEQRANCVTRAWKAMNCLPAPSFPCSTNLLLVSSTEK